MEKNFFRAVAVMAIAVLCGSAANAQNESTNVSDSARVDVQEQVINQIKGEVHYGVDPAVTSEAAWNVLKAAPADTLITTAVEVFSDTTVTRCGIVFELTPKDTLFVHWKYFLSGPREIRKDPLCILNQHIQEEIPVMSPLEQTIARKAKETAVVDLVNAGRERDHYGYRVKFSNGNEYTLTTKAKDKFGVFAGVYAGGQIASGMGGFRGGFEAGYSWSWGMALAQVGASHNRYTDNATAENANKKMWAFEARAGAGPTLYFGKWKQWSVSLLGGISETSYKTDSREVVTDGSSYLLQSRGNAWSWWLGTRVACRGFNGLGMAGVQVDFTKVPNVIQNQGQIGRNAFTFTAFCDFDFFRGLVNHK